MMKKYRIKALFFCLVMALPNVSLSQSLESIVPDSGTQGASFPVTITGLNTNWQSSPYSYVNVYFSGDGIDVSNETIQNNTTVTADISILNTATVGQRTVFLEYYDWYTLQYTLSLPNGFTVIGYFSISGKVSYYKNDNPVPQAVMTLTGHATGSTTTDASGGYLLGNLEVGNYRLTPSKANAVGSSISPYDASLVLRYYVGLISLTPYQLIAADVSGNGQVSPFDASYILRYYVGLISRFPVVKDWTFVPTDFAITLTNWPAAPDYREYNPLDKDETAQDFYGIVYGDVSGNWLVAGSEPLARGGSEVFTINPGEAAHAESGITVPVLVDRAGLLSAGFTLRYDPSVLKATSVSGTELTSAFSSAFKVDDGQVTVALAGARATEKAGCIANVHFNLVTDDVNAVSPLELSDVILNNGNLLIQTQDGKFSLKAAVPTEYALSQNYPNPFSAKGGSAFGGNPETSIKYQLPEKGHVVLKVYNIVGQEIRSLVDEAKEAGYYEVIWDGRDSSGQQVSSGMYLYRLQVGEFVATKKMALLR